MDDVTTTVREEAERLVLDMIESGDPTDEKAAQYAAIYLMRQAGTDVDATPRQRVMVSSTFKEGHVSFFDGIGSGLDIPVDAWEENIQAFRGFPALSELSRYDRYQLETGTLDDWAPIARKRRIFQRLNLN